MKIIMFVYTIILFVLLTPSILFRFPRKGKKWTVAFVHGIIFAIIYYFTHMFFCKIDNKEQFKLYGDSNCNNTNVIAGPEKSIPSGIQSNIYFSDLNNNCVGPFAFADRTQPPAPAAAAPAAAPAARTTTGTTTRR